MTNWEKHFRAMAPAKQPDFGTVNGQYTVAELQDLVAAKDVQVANLATQLAEVQGMRVPFDLSGVQGQYDALKARYDAARADAQKAIDAAAWSWSVPNSLLPADAQYKGLLTALNPKWQQNTWAPGDGSIEDISQTLKSMGATGKGDKPTPQPRASSDASLGVLKTSSGILDVAEGAAEGLGALTGKAASGLAKNIDMSTVIKLGLVVGIGLLVVPRLLPVKL